MSEGERKSKRIGRLLLTYSARGAKGVVPNHGPRQRRIMASWGTEGWRVHITLDSLRTWDGLRDFDFGVALHPSKRRRERLQSEWTCARTRTHVTRGRTHHVT